MEPVCRKYTVLLFINRRWLWFMFYFQLANLTLFSNTRKTRLLLSVVKRTRDFVTCTIVRAERYLSHSSCKGKYLLCEFSFLFQ
ncbi:UNVERIFIED_CONTAM: hypothetical protein NCL1_53817 [Trichonephila clavipes]